MANVATGQNFLKDAGQYEREQIFAKNAEELGQARANSSLPPESWNSMDDQIYRGEDATLKLVADLRAAGLTTSADITDETLEWQRVDTSHSATIAMSVETETDDGGVTYDKQGVPLPVIFSGYSSGFREDGSGSNAELNAYGASYVVNKTFEEMVLYGWNPSIGTDGYSLNGIINHPDKSTGTVSDWATEPSSARVDVRAMRDDIKNEQNHAPGRTGYWLYLASDLWDMGENYVHSQEGITIMDRISSLASISKIDELESLAPGTMLMFRPTIDVIDLAMAIDLRPVQWGGPFRDNYLTMLAGTPRVKTTYQGESGIAYYS